MSSITRFTAAASSGLSGLYIIIWWKLPSPTWPNTVENKPSFEASLLHSSTVHQPNVSILEDHGRDVPIISAMRDMGTATSVDHTSVPSGRTARHAQSACFRADQSEAIVSSSVAESNERHADDLATFFAALMLSFIAWSVPENLWRSGSDTAKWP